MKSFCVILISFWMTLTTCQGQVWCGGIGLPEDWNFDGGFLPWDYLLQIDTTTYPNNIWQIGAPQKSTINSPYSVPRVIITDTINSYPPNDTSVFIFKHIDQGGYSAPHSAELSGFYYVNSDSLNDYGTMEISLDHGATWINLITDTTYSSYYTWITPKPTLTGNSYGWKGFHVDVAHLGLAFNVNPADTILLRFTFISDGVAENLDGLAFDSFQFCDGLEGVEEVFNNNLITIYPNPVSHLLFIKRNTRPLEESIRIFNYTGQLVFINNHFNANSIDVGKLNLKNGFYFLKYINAGSYAVKKFTIESD